MKNTKSIENITPTKNAKLEKKRSIFFQIGLIMSLAIVFAAFEWTTVNTHNISDWNLGEDIIIEEMAPITKQDIPKPPSKPIIQASIIEVVPDNKDLKEIDIIFIEPDEGLNDLTYFDEEPDVEPEEPVVFFVSETKPFFPGGESALYAFLAENLIYPEAARDAGIKGPVYVCFVVWNDGSIRDVKVLRGIGGGCDEEALRVVKMMPKWNPGLQRTKPVNVQMVLPVKFVIK